MGKELGYKDIYISIIIKLSLQKEDQIDCKRVSLNTILTIDIPY